MKAGKDNSTPQKVSYSFIKILTGSDLSRRRLPFMSIQTEKPGPVVWLTGCIHGDEVTGIVTIQEVFKRIQRQGLLRGRLCAFPLMNPIGFETASRNITLSREDLNSSFPGNKEGTLAERIADKIFTTINATGPSLVLDLHNDWMKSIPYTLIDVQTPDNRDAHERAKTAAGESGFLVISETEHQRRSLSYNLLQQGIPALTVELGESYVVNEDNVRYGLKSIINILACLGMVPKTEEAFEFPLPEAARGRMLNFSPGPVSSASGITRFLASPGDLVKKGQPVAKIYNTFGKLQATIPCVNDGIVLGHADSSVAFPGAPLMAFGNI